MMDPGDAAAERRKQRPGYVDPGPVDEYTGTTAVATRKEEKSAFRRAFESVAERAGITSVFAKLQGLKQTGAYKKGEEALEDMRERWETSDSPLVHRIPGHAGGALDRDRAGGGVQDHPSATARL